MTSIEEDRNMTLNSSFGFMLAKAAQKIADIAQESLTPLQLDTRQVGLLMTIKKYEPITQTRISKLLRIDRTTMVALINDLENRGLVVRTESSQDRRVNNLALTAKGTEILDQAWKRILESEEKGLHGLSTSEKQSLIKTLEKITGY
ncbi:MAG: MarR family winged helix-turn-helix transcriptional regulator [Thermoplasmata archaeon]